MLTRILVIILLTAVSAFAQNTGELLPVPIQPFNGTLGTVIAAGRLCTTLTGTTTSSAVYSDSALTTTLPNPIVLDSLGRPTTNGSTVTSVYLGARSYRIALYANGTGNTCNGTAVGTQIYSRDNIYNLSQLHTLSFTTQLLDKVCHAAAFTGTSPNNAGGKIRACIDALPATGGTVDIRGLEGSQTVTADPFTSVTKPVQLILGAATFTISATSTAPANVSWIVNAGTLLLPAADTTLTVNGGFDGSMDNHFCTSSSVCTGLGSVVLNGPIPQIPVQWCGASGTDGASDLTAFRRCLVINQASGQSSSFGSGANSGTRPALLVPPGIYDIDGNITDTATEINYLKIVGESNQSIIEVAAGITFLSEIKYNFEMENIVIRGGATALSISTDASDSSLITVTDSEFWQQTATVILVAATSAPTQILVQNSKLITDISGGKIIDALSSDYIKFANNWVFTSAPIAFDVTGVNLTLLENIFVDEVGVLTWVDIKGAGHFLALDNRFGAENSGPDTAIITNRMSGDFVNPSFPVTIRILSTHATYTSGTLIKFFAIPNVVEVRGAYGLQDTVPFIVDSTVPAADLIGICSLFHIFNVEWNSQSYNSFITSTTGTPASHAKEGLPLCSDGSVMSSRPLTADLVLQSAGNTGAYTPVVDATATRSTPSDEFGVTVEQWTTTANDQYADLDYTAALSGLSAGVYTAVFDFAVVGWGTSTTINMGVQGSYTQKRMPLSRGRHTISLPFYYDGGAEQSIRAAAYTMPLGATVQWQRFRVYNGNWKIDTKNAEVAGTAAPGSGQWYRGDTVFNTNRTALTDQVCWQNSVSGTPGTWIQCTATLNYGTITPTYTGVTNAASIVASGAQWSQVGTIVSVSGSVAFTAAATGTTQVGISLPVASNFTDVGQCAGTASDGGNQAYSGFVYADTGNDRCELFYTTVVTGAVTWRYQFIYQINCLLPFGLWGIRRRFRRSCARRLQ